MRGLTSDLLDVARIETGTLLVALGSTDATRLVVEAWNTFLNSGVGNDLHIAFLQVSCTWRDSVGSKLGSINPMSGIMNWH